MYWILPSSPFSYISRMKQELAAVDDRLGHHVLEARPADQIADLAALVDRRGHRHGTQDVLAGPQRRDRHPGVVRDGRVDVDEIDVRVRQHVVVVRVPLLDAEGIGDAVQLRSISPADGEHVRVGMTLVDGDELGPETEAHDRHVELLVRHGRASLAISTHPSPACGRGAGVRVVGFEEVCW